MSVRYLPIAALTLLGLALRVYHLDFQSLWRDEVDVLMFSSRGLDDLIRNFLKQGENGPLYYVLHHFWLPAFGDSEVALRLPSTLFATAVIPLIYRLGRLLLDRASALSAALLAALSPYYVWYSQDAKMYSLFLMLTVLSFLLYVTALRTGKPAAWAGYIFVSTIELYVHFFAALVILAQIAVFLLCFRERQKVPWALSMGVLTLPYLPLAVWQVPTLISPPVTQYPSYGASGVASLLLVLFVRGFSPVPAVFPLLLAVFILLAGLVFYGRPGELEETRRSDFVPGQAPSGTRMHWGLTILLVWLLLPVAAFLLISTRMPLFTDRYLIIITPAFYLLVAAGLTALRRHWRPIAYLALALWLGMGLHSLSWQATTPLKSDFRSAAIFFEERAEPDDLLVFHMPYSHYTFQYYYRRPIQWKGAPYTNDGQTPAVVDRLMSSEVGDSSVVWLISSEEWLWDARGLVREWLQANLTTAQTWDGVGVRLERYRRQPQSAVSDAMPTQALSRTSSY